MTFSPLGLELLGGDPPDESASNLAAGHATASGSLTVDFALSVEADGVATAVADLTVTTPAGTAIDGVSNSHGSASASLGVKRPFTGSAAGVATVVCIPSPKFLAGRIIAHARASGVLDVGTSSPGTKNPLILGPFERVYDLNGVTTTINDRPLLFT